jgi:putative intracellular protease/amidase
MASKRALIVITSNDGLGDTGKKTGWYLSEVTHVYYPLVEAGFAVDFASPQGGAAPMDESSRKLDDPENKRFLEDPELTVRLRQTLPLADIDPKQYAVVHFAGGHGVMWDLPADAEVERVAAGVYEHGGIVAAVCHGPAALVDVKLTNGDYLVAGHDVAAFTNAEEEAVGLTKVVPFLLEAKLAERGARVHPARNWQSQVMVSGRLITGQNPQSARALGHRIVEVAKASC